MDGSSKTPANVAEQLGIWEDQSGQLITQAEMLSQ